MRRIDLITALSRSYSNTTTGKTKFHVSTDQIQTLLSTCETDPEDLKKLLKTVLAMRGVRTVYTSSV
jgi:hypothetical protein